MNWIGKRHPGQRADTKIDIDGQWRVSAAGLLASDLTRSDRAVRDWSRRSVEAESVRARARRIQIFLLSFFFFLSKVKIGTRE